MTRLLLRWGVWLCYSEWTADQPDEDWSGKLTAEGGAVRNPKLVMYHGCWGAQRRTFIELDRPEWTSPLIHFERPIFGYKGLEGLLIDVDGDDETALKFHSNMLDAEFRLGDIPAGGKLVFPAGAKYSCSQLVVCRPADEGVYWNDPRSAELPPGSSELTPEQFCGDFVPRDMHHRQAGWVPPGGTIDIPFDSDGARPLIATWRFTGSWWAAKSDSGMFEMLSGSNSPVVDVATALDGKPLSIGRYKAKYMRGANSALEHTDALGDVAAGEHLLSIANHSADKVYLVLNGCSLRPEPADWTRIRGHLPFQPGWDSDAAAPDHRAADLPSGGRGAIVGYDTNMLAAENGWIDAAIAFLANTGGGNYVLFRTESDAVSAEMWHRWFTACRDGGIYFAINTAITTPAMPIGRLLDLAGEIGGEYFLGQKCHELSLPLYSGRKRTDYPPTRTLADAEGEYLQYVRESYQQGGDVPKLLGEGALAHRYAYKGGVDLILSETMTGHSSLLLAEARGAAKAFGRDFWGLHIACHVNSSPEDERHERMFPLNLQLGYLSGASLLEDEEGGLAKVHSFVSGPTDPLPLQRQRTMTAFYRWARAHPRTGPLKVDIGLLYGRHDAITGGMSLLRDRPVRVWDGFGPACEQWEYRDPEYGWLLADLLLPGVWLCPVLQDPKRLRRWFSGTPYGQADVVPIEADTGCLSDYRLLILPGWHTMTDEDADKLVRFVESGGTLVMCLPQLQTSADRTAVLSSLERPFAPAEITEKLCGLHIDGPGRTVEGPANKLGDLKPLTLADVSLTGGTADVELDGRPLVVKHAPGAGCVYTWVANEYFGHPSLQSPARRWLEGLLDDFPLDVRLSGGDGEVAWFVYEEGASRRVYLVNTDWTVPGNEKHCVLHAGDRSEEVIVREGEVAEVVLPS